MTRERNYADVVHLDGWEVLHLVCLHQHIRLRKRGVPNRVQDRLHWHVRSGGTLWRRIRTGSADNGK